MAFRRFSSLGRLKKYRPLRYASCAVGIDARCGGQPRLLARREAHVHFVGDRRRQFRLQRQHIARLPFEGLGPEVLVRARIDQLRGDPHRVADARHRSLDDSVHVELGGDVRCRRPILAAELHHRSPGDDAELADRRQVRGQLIGHAFGEVVLVGIARVVVERKHGDRSDESRGDGHRRRRTPRCGLHDQVARPVSARSPARPSPLRFHRGARAGRRARAHGRLGRRHQPRQVGTHLRGRRVPVLRILGQQAMEHGLHDSEECPRRARRARAARWRASLRPKAGETDVVRRSSPPESRRTKTDRTVDRARDLSPAPATCSRAYRRWRRAPSTPSRSTRASPASGCGRSSTRLARPKSITFTCPAGSP